MALPIKTRMQNLAKKVFGTQNERELKSIYPIVGQINGWESKIKVLSDLQLKAKTVEFRERLAKDEKLDALLPEAFAVVREASKRVRGERHYDVQMIGGITLHRGRIAEMRTGEGKTLVSTLPAYLNALTSKGVHIVTVNDYLAKRDAEQMGQVHNFLGLSVGIIAHGLTDKERQKNYGCDITYGTNSEFGFDYLRDNMKFRLEDYVQRDLHFSIVDEVDSILIDEARTPLIISGPTEDRTDLYYKIDRQIIADGGLIPEIDYTVEEKTKTAALSEAGVEKMEKRLGITNLYDPNNIEILHHVNQGLRAHVLFKRDVDYVVKEGEVMIVDEFTGRMMPGRRWSDGLHQAIEAKENVNIENENQTLATITYQNFFRMYGKLSGMTGTADTEATEFKQIYKLDVTVIPTNRPMIRNDQADVIFKTEAGKFKNIADEIKLLHAKGQPVLVGTVSVDKSEKLSALLKREGIKHNVLNAKQHDREAGIIAEAGRKGAVTIATNMAGRGTDILLGGNSESVAREEVGLLPIDATEEQRIEHEKKLEEALASTRKKFAAEKEEVLKAGGLFILGTERHESRRIDNQLRGRSGRQGDPGASRFYLSLDDDLMRIFGSVNIGRFMEEDMPIEHRWITKAIENAQKKVEGHNYDIRKHLLEYDDVMNQQRQVVYAWRKEVLSQPTLRDMVFSMVDELAGAIADDFFPNGKLKKENGNAHLNIKELTDAVITTLQFKPEIHEKDIAPFNNVGLKKLIIKQASAVYEQKEKALTETTMRQLEKMILLTTIDHLWKDHLLAMDHLREGVGLQGYGQKDPLVIYKKEGFGFFSMMMNQITGDAVRKLFVVQMAPPPEALEEEFEEQDAFADAGSMQYNLTENGELIPAQGLAGAGMAQQQPAPQSTGPMAAPAQPQRAQAPNPFERQMNVMMRGPQKMNGGQTPTPAGAGAQQVGRNDLCPCGSGKKYKKCHGA
jgi:preprotein translocase subunit SecA